MVGVQAAASVERCQAQRMLSMPPSGSASHAVTAVVVCGGADSVTAPGSSASCTVTVTSADTESCPSVAVTVTVWLLLVS